MVTGINRRSMRIGFQKSGYETVPGRQLGELVGSGI